ncbi:MAG TPA: NAD(P)/FAD-dependent oxidoreductase [Chthoniobacterales bacterium]|nr:NAD(P)/FAD-dependent oxidoreductase [Chthoniobacterales bacterium]
MDRADVAIVGGGPAGASCAFFCAQAGLRTVVLERETFPREKVCGDCLNPACWPVLRRLGIADEVKAVPHGRLEKVEFIGIGGARVSISLPVGDGAEIALKRSLFDHLLLQRAGNAGAEILEGAMVTRVEKARWGDWKIDVVRDKITAPILVAADGRNSTVARLRGLLPATQRERVALQTHIPLPAGFGNRVVLQLLEEGYSGQAPVNADELNLCLVSAGADIDRLKAWAAIEFKVSSNHPWRTITPLARSPLGPMHDNLFLIGDVARVVEPFTGEGIYYALRSGELAAEAIIAIAREENRQVVLRRFTRQHRQMYRGRLWVNQMARAAVLSPRIGSAIIRVAKVYPGVLRQLTRKITGQTS